MNQSLNMSLNQFLKNNVENERECNLEDSENARQKIKELLPDPNSNIVNLELVS